MPIHDLGYRNWIGQREAGGTRWMVIAGIGIRRAWQNMWIRRMMFFAWVPAMLGGIWLFAFEQAGVANSPLPVGQIQMLGLMSWFDPAAREAILQDVQNAESVPEAIALTRSAFWSFLLMLLFQRTQGTLLILVIGMIVPPLISQDIRSRAFLLYFSRPINRLQYIGGKAAAVVTYLLVILLLPALVLYVAGVLLSPSVSIVAYTWDLPLRALACTMVAVIPTTSLALMLSSVTTETRYATFSWFAIWIFGGVAYFSVSLASNLSGQSTEGVLRKMSLYHVILDVEEWIFGRSPWSGDIAIQCALLTVISVVSLAVVFRRVTDLMRQ